jgi:hypothetical protein
MTQSAKTAVIIKVPQIIINYCDKKIGLHHKKVRSGSSVPATAV